MADGAKILTWAGGWGLPSLDPSCLQALAYAKFSGFPVKVEHCINPYKSPTGSLPVLTLPDDVVCGCDDIIEYLKANNNNADEELSDKQKLDTLGLCCYVEDMLRPALLYMLWLDDTNYTQFTRGWYAKQLKFPYNYIIPAQYFNHATNFIAHKLNIYESDVICDVTEEKLKKRAQTCFEVLNDVLGDQEFFLGDSPTTLDSKVLSYLAIVLNIPLPKNKLKPCILEYPKLEEYCSKVLHLYFPDAINEVPSSRVVSGEEDESRNKINAVLSVGFAVVAMVFYAMSSGIVRIEVEERELCDDCAAETQNNEE